MGYYIYLGDHEFTLQASQFDAVLERWRKFEEDNPPAYPSASVFHEYPNDLPVLVPKTVPDIFQEMGFEVAADDQAMTIEGWEGKAGYEHDYITAIADLVDEGWFLDWTGEDDERWRVTAEDSFTGETVFIKPNLEYRLRDLTKMLDEYDDSPVAQGPELTEQVLREISAVGPIIAAVRALIEDLS
jgi:hypothetical protein